MTPSFRARERTSSSGEPVTRIVGIACPISMRCLWSSIPVIAGMLTSVIRQAVSTSRGDARKSAADEKASALWPSDLISLLMESRKNRSSSTTEIRKAFGIRTPAIHSPPRRNVTTVTCAKGATGGNPASGKLWLIPRANFAGVLWRRSGLFMSTAWEYDACRRSDLRTERKGAFSDP
jgi:hypothetical protein